MRVDDGVETTGLRDRVSKQDRHMQKKVGRDCPSLGGQTVPSVSVSESMRPRKKTGSSELQGLKSP